MDKIKNFIAHPLLRNSIVVFAGSMGANIAGWLYHLLVGRILGTERYGELAALLSLFYILNVPSSVLQTVMVKFFSVMKAQKDEGQAKRLIQVATSKILLFEGIGMLFIFFLSPYIASFLHIESSSYIIWLYLILATFMVAIVNGSAIQGFQLFTAFSVLTTVGMLLRLVFGVAFAFFGVGWTLISNILSNIVSYSLTFLPLRFFVKIIAKPLTINRQKAVGFSVPTFVTMLGMTLLYSQDVLLVKHYFTSHEAGIYASLSVLGKVIFFASAAVGFVLFPVLSERKASGKTHKHIVAMGLLLIGSGCFVLTVLYYMLPQLIILAFGKAFEGATPYLGSFAIFMSLISLTSIMITVLLAIDKTNVWILTFVFSVVQLILISLFHDTIAHVIGVNIAVSVALFSSLLLYYAYGKTKD